MKLEVKRGLFVISLFAIIIIGLSFVSAYSTNTISGAYFTPPANYNSETINVVASATVESILRTVSYTFVGISGGRYYVDCSKVNSVISCTLAYYDLNNVWHSVETKSPSPSQFGGMTLTPDRWPATWSYTESAPALPIQTILKISSVTNAHGEIYSGTNYNTIINYSNIFGKNYTKTSPNTCNATNIILKLSAVTNAHAQTTTQTGYTTNVCYGDLVCSVATGGASCPAGKLPVVKLSGVTNAHLATTTASSTDYPVTICCSSPFASGGGTTPVCPVTPVASDVCTGLTVNVKDSDNNICRTVAGTASCSAVCPIGESPANICSGLSVNVLDSGGKICKVVDGTKSCTTGEITRVYWTDNADNEILDINPNDGRADIARYVGQTVKLVAEAAGTSGTVTFNIKENDLAINDNIRTGLSATIGADGKAVYSWEITSADMTAGLAGGGEDGVWEFFFTASTTNSMDSDMLNVLNDNWVNTPPTALIDSSIAGAFLAGVPITFTHESTDTESEINVQWNFGDGTTSTEDTFAHTYTLNAGEISRAFTVTLTAIDLQGEEDSAEVVIIIINPTIAGTSPVPIINKPLEGALLTGKIVNYQGDSSYAITVQTSPALKLICAGGNCPASISGTAVTNDNSKKGVFDDLSFKWTFGSDDSSAVQEDYAKISGVKVYKTIGNNKEIRLALTISGKTYTAINKFSILRDTSCSAGGDYYIDSRNVLYSTDIPGVCSLASPYCCPSGSICDTTNSAGSTCSVAMCEDTYEEADGDLNSIISCDGYNKIDATSTAKKFQCEQDCTGVEDDEDNPEYIAAKERLGFISSSQCIWKTSTSKCVFEATADGGIGEIPQILTLDDCVATCENRIGTTICFDEEGNQLPPVNYDCGSHVIALPFFSLLNVLAVVVLLVLAYLIFGKKRKGRK